MPCNLAQSGTICRPEWETWTKKPTKEIINGKEKHQEPIRIFLQMWLVGDGAFNGLTVRILMVMIKDKKLMFNAILKIHT